MSTLVFSSCVNFVQAVEQGLQYETDIPANLLPRLCECCTKVNEPAHVKFRFYRDLQGLNTIEGDISCAVSFTCQRCGKDFLETLSAHFCSTPDKEKACSLRIEDKLDIVELNEGGEFELLSFIEDCLMLEVPYVPKHEDGDPECQENSDWSFGEIATDRENPFARLAELKQKMHKE